MPTKEPTNTPSQSPTKNPTYSPTKAPTKQPTNTPTKFPTKQPTNTPTKFPTKQPTNSPTSACYETRPDRRRMNGKNNAKGSACKFPFTYSGKTYSSCTKDGCGLFCGNHAWCYTTTGGDAWGVCTDACQAEVGVKLAQEDDEWKEQDGDDLTLSLKDSLQGKR